jgi:hypothetical protein
LVQSVCARALEASAIEVTKAIPVKADISRMTISSCTARPMPRAPFDRVGNKACSLLGQSQQNQTAACKFALHT